jgi:hypothetical protein
MGIRCKFKFRRCCCAWRVMLNEDFALLKGPECINVMCTPWEYQKSNCWWASGGRGMGVVMGTEEERRGFGVL